MIKNMITLQQTKPELGQTSRELIWDFRSKLIPSVREGNSISSLGILANTLGKLETTMATLARIVLLSRRMPCLLPLILVSISSSILTTPGQTQPLFRQ